MTTLSPRFLKAFNSRFTCRALIPSSSAASRRVITFLWALRNVTSRSLSAWVISSCPSCIPKAWGCQDDISTLLKDDILILLPQQYPRGMIKFFFTGVGGFPLAQSQLHLRLGIEYLTKNERSTHTGCPKRRSVVALSGRAE